MGLPLGPRNSVVAIGTSGGGTAVEWVASGFFLAAGDVPGNADAATNMFLVTNRHVAEGLESFVIRLETEPGTPPLEVAISAAGSASGWILHSEPGTDVAVLDVSSQIAGPTAGHVIPCSDFTSSTLSDLDELGFGEGDEVFVLGFPMGMVNEQMHQAIVRRGCVARIRDVYAGYSTTILLDAPVYPGNSGGPVVASLQPRPDEESEDKRFHVIGVVASYVPYHDVAISPQTNSIRVVFQENSGLSRAYPMDRVWECVDEALRVCSGGSPA